MSQTRTWRYQDAVKDPVVEEWVDYHVHRRVAFWLIRPLEGRLEWVTPARITYLSILVGLMAAGACFLGAEHGRYWNGVGGVLLFVSVVLDCADGMLARLRGGGTRFGMLLDGAGDFIVGLAYWAGLSWQAKTAFPDTWALVCIVGIFLSAWIHTMLYDGYRGKYVRNAVKQSEQKVEAKAPADLGPLASFLFRFLDGWYERVFGFVQKNLARTDADARLSDPESFKKTMRGPMRSASWLGLGTHMAVFYAAGISGAFFDEGPFLISTILGVGVLNVWMLFAIVRWKRAERTLSLA